MSIPSTEFLDIDRLFSMDALRRAWVQVRRSGGSPGTDGVTVQAFESQLDLELNKLRQHILNGHYRPQPVQRYYKQKSSGKSRPLSIWAVRDRVAQRVVLNYLTPFAERLFFDYSFGFRPNRSTDDAVQALVATYQNNLRWVLDADISECFDSISADLLLSQCRRIIPQPELVKLIEKWLNTQIARHLEEKAGVSQGSVIAPLLANIYLHRFDEMIAAALPESQLIRFADDFLILSRTKKEAYWSMSVAERSLQNLRLSMNMEKTKIVHFEQGFSFLGFSFKGHKVGREENKEET